MADRTKGPWSIDPKRAMRIVAGDDNTIATTGCQSDFRDAWEANAAAIVRWENSFDELVAALEEALVQLEAFQLEATDESYNSLQINAALAKARGVKS